MEHKIRTFLKQQLIAPFFKPRNLLPIHVVPKYQVIFENVAMGMAIVDLQGQFIKVNKALCDMLGYNEGELLSLNFKVLSLPEDLPESMAWINASLAGEISHSFSKIKRYHHQKGYLVWTKLTTTLVRNEKNEPQYFISSIQSIGELKQAEKALDESLEKLQRAYQALEQMSCKDGLTGALNIKAFKEQLNSAIVQFGRYDIQSTLIFIDLDKFKEINDQYGHLLGDQALIILAAKLQHNIRHCDAVGRYGGDEFAILLTNTGKAQAQEYCRRIGQSFIVEHEQGEKFTVGISFGLCQTSSDINNVEQWLDLADKQMYQHKLCKSD